MSDKPSATELLQNYDKDPDAFWMAVRQCEVVSPKPWKHSEHLTDGCCERCAIALSKGYGLEDAYWQDCPVPPELRESPAELAFRLRDLVDFGSTKQFMRATRFLCIPRGYQKYDSRLYWWGLKAKPHEQIAVCLVALGEWRT
jgi:hypothetical protein